MTDYRLDVQGISKSFGGVKAIEDFSFQVPAHDIVGIIGPNGAGKSTCFNLLTGVYPLDTGKILLDGKDISGLPQYEITKSGIARTFQNIRLFHGLNVLENIMTAADPYSTYGLWDVFTFSDKKKQRETEVRELSRKYLEIVGLKGYEEYKPESLAYGLQRKLEIARALATNPKVLLLDEPAAGLNPSEVRDFIGLIKKLNSQFDFSIVIIEHRMEVIMELSSRIFVLNFGKLLASGTPAEIVANREVTEAYMGEEDEACLL
ncbi:ABC transporter ATP-binding protein [Sporomusa sp.]|uniref:ABC transporter ATP-binding protein n=1 Tax=Sporomusa sp. TaxID=2078658 RepID=UPI002BB915EF|nr:ABC transporter ATP-binding protein [Sporomusa sp.]HWR41886.1 ABC transporter ATP-binding protein [Sporomusa sp.]